MKTNTGVYGRSTFLKLKNQVKEGHILQRAMASRNLNFGFKLMVLSG
jgi:hypothetical protein